MKASTALKVASAGLAGAYLGRRAFASRPSPKPKPWPDLLDIAVALLKMDPLDPREKGELLLDFMRRMMGDSSFKSFIERTGLLNDRDEEVKERVKKIYKRALAENFGAIGRQLLDELDRQFALADFICDLLLVDRSDSSFFNRLVFGRGRFLRRRGVRKVLDDLDREIDRAKRNGFTDLEQYGTKAKALIEEADDPAQVYGAEGLLRP